MGLTMAKKDFRGQAELHIACKDVGWDSEDATLPHYKTAQPETRRQMMKRVTGKSSSARMNFLERRMIIDECLKYGYIPLKKTKKQRFNYQQAQSRLMISYWNKWFKAGIINNKTNRAFETWIANQINQPSADLPQRINPDNLNSLQRNQLIEALKSRLKKGNK